MASLLESKAAVITGAGSGIGRASALAFAREGARVVVSDIVSESGNETVNLIKQAGGEAIFIRCDVAQPQEIAALIHGTVETYGRLDCAVNNAGIAGVQATTADYPLENWQKVININLTAPWLCMKYELAQMVKQGMGAIVNMASILGTTGFAQSGAYVAAKHGLVGATRTAALEYAKSGIRVNAVCPGFIETPLLQQTEVGSNAQILQFIANLHPIGRLGTPEEIANMVLWLCSDAASFVTGATMIVDGGYTAQ
jgi:NAD(P)-dependent dehydrogenase (short-subunit alcohol dehydrogenase family)